ncbi:MAG: aminopeptidase [Armatimonadota bacterium]
MLDPRVASLARVLTTHSLELGPADAVLIHTFDTPAPVVAAIVEAVQATGARVALRQEENLVKRQLLLGMTEENARMIAEIEHHEMEQMTAYIAIRGADNATEMADVPGDIMQMWQREYAVPVVFGVRIPKTKWVVLRWPNPAMAQAASMSTRAFEDFYFRVCNLDYAQMARAVEPLVDLMNRTDRVRVTAPGTDFSFTIRGIGSVPCTGRRNIPDGECFSAPVPGTVEGMVRFNTRSLYQGTIFEEITYRMAGGRIVEASAGANTGKLNDILDTDEGGRAFGEFSIGFHPHILEPMLDTLFDEKIAGSIHFTPGSSYAPPGGNGNESAIHWDTVLIQRPEYGGGDIYFDDVLIRKDGIFVLPALLGLNPDRLG